MKLKETFGFEQVPIPHRVPGTQWREGRPNAKRVKKRPNKNLWFNDDKLWKQDLDLEHGGNYILVTDENEEKIIACDQDKKWAHGFWNKKQNKGITYKSPRPMSMVIHPKTTLKDFITR